MRRTPDARPFGLQICRLKKLQNTTIELRIAVQDDVAVRTCFGKGLTQLLDYSLRGWMLGHVEVQNLPATVLDNEEAIRPVDSVLHPITIAI